MSARSSAGAYIRVAADRHMLDRDETAAMMRRSVAVVDQRDDFLSTLPVAATGDAVMIACQATDQLGWVFDQMSEYDTVGVCAGGPSTDAGGFIWWSFIVGKHAERLGDKPLESLASGGLTSESTVIEFMRAHDSATGRTLVSA